MSTNTFECKGCQMLQKGDTDDAKSFCGWASDEEYLGFAMSRKPQIGR